VTFGSTAPTFGGGSASVLAAGLSDYLPIVLMAILAVVFAVASLGASAVLRPRRPNRPKLSAYESGNDPVRLPGGERFGVKFYVVAMLFIIFDIETIFLFPWAVTFRDLGLFGLIEMAVFIALVFVAYVYIWRKGGLDWTTAPPQLSDDEEDEAELAPARRAEEEYLGAR
jgi:NADH-quinone oxidoreductase subunit A